MKQDFIILYSKHNETFHMKRSGTYKQVEVWAYDQIAEQEWEAFGIKVDGEDGWSEETA